MRAAALIKSWLVANIQRFSTFQNKRSQSCALWAKSAGRCGFFKLASRVRFLFANGNRVILRPRLLPRMVSALSERPSSEDGRPLFFLPHAGLSKSPYQIVSIVHKFAFGGRKVRFSPNITISKLR